MNIVRNTVVSKNVVEYDVVGLAAVAEMINNTMLEKYAIVVPKLMSKSILPNLRNRFQIGIRLPRLHNAISPCNARR